jgi:hypothetical protein
MIRISRLWPQIVAHADMNAFYAAIEQLDDPSLRGKPLLVGPPNARGVVLTASDEARPGRRECDADGSSATHVPKRDHGGFLNFFT